MKHGMLLAAALALVFAACGGGPTSPTGGGAPTPPIASPPTRRDFKDVFQARKCGGYTLNMTLNTSPPIVWRDPGVITLHVEPVDASTVVDVYFFQTAADREECWLNMLNGKTCVPPAVKEDRRQKPGEKTVTYNWTPPPTRDNVDFRFYALLCNRSSADETLVGYLKYEAN